MENLNNLKVNLLNKKELSELNGGESGIYYIARGCKAIYNGVCDAAECASEWLSENGSEIGAAWARHPH